MAKALNVPTFAIFSPWIKKEAWNGYENERNGVVHLKDYRPELYKEASTKSKAGELYQLFKPEIFLKKYVDFVKTYA